MTVTRLAGVLTPAAAAQQLRRALGASRALVAAQTLKAEHTEYSPASAFYDEVARILERGIVTARNEAARLRMVQGFHMLAGQTPPVSL